MRPGHVRSTAPRVVVVLVLALGLAACGPQATPAPSGESSAAPAASGVGSAVPGTVGPSASAGQSLPPSPAASQAAARPIEPGIAATVLVSLNVRQYPTTSAKRVGTLAKGDIVYLLGYGGVQAGGNTWFEAGRIKGLHGQLPALPTWPIAGGSWTDLSGWIAIGTAGSPYIAALPPRCGADAATNLTTLSAMLPGEQLACLGKQPLVLQGTFGCGGCGGSFPGTFTPEWLATPLSGMFSANYSRQVGPLQLYFPPGMTRPKEGLILRVHGHLDDSRASTCKVAVPTSDALLAAPVPVRAADAQAWCEEHIVVDSYDVIGPDPSYPPA